MGDGSKGQEDDTMKCHVCGGRLEPSTTDLPFRTGPSAIVIIKGVPALECTNCPEFLLEDPVMERVEGLLSRTDEAAELEIVAYAA